MEVSEVAVLREDCDRECPDFTADEPFLLLWDVPQELDLSAVTALHRRRSGAVTLALKPYGGDNGWVIGCDERGRVCYLEEKPPVPRCEGLLTCAGVAICEPMPGIPLPVDGESLLALLRFWMDRGELWGTCSVPYKSRAAMCDEVTENPLYFL